ncbi:MAG: 2-oxoacid:acceptor oxidoreductase family protein [Oscillospiraceae bacterium]|nr:2-oxoacid:acceptor oxidoreductase family protein [Oscillospiraceae bacterium]
MSKTYEILFAGFGGQGVLFGGKAISEMGLIDGKEVSWMPSYGPAMRGGTCNCSVVISDTPIGSPVVNYPDLAVIMNTPSYEKFIGAVKSGGKAFVDSSLTNSVMSAPENVEVFNIPATKLASENNLVGMANIIMLGKLIKETGIASQATVEQAMRLCTKGKEKLYELNTKALKLGAEF